MSHRHYCDVSHKPSHLYENGKANVIQIPPDAEQKVERALSQLGTYKAVCFWCGYGYEEYTRKAEDEHFANRCPEAPQELKDRASARLTGVEKQ